MTYENASIKAMESSNAYQGTVSWSSLKSIWSSSCYLIALIGGVWTFNWDAFLLFLLFTAFVLCFGHSLGMHRKLIHQSFDCPKWLEYFLVHLGVIVGLAGPIGMLRTHDTRDWAQRQAQCHPYFGHQKDMLTDWWWQVHCDIKLNRPPEFKCPEGIKNDAIYHWMEKHWILQQLPWAVLFFLLGGISWVIWGIFVRVAVSITGHWLIGYFAHNNGHQHWLVDGADIQGHNIKYTSLITMGESLHNNHHAFPNSAKFALKKGELDPGWWVLKVLELIKLASHLKTPDDLPKRKELINIEKN